MSGITIKDGENFEKALKRFNREVSPIRKEAKKREFFLSKKEKRKLKSKNNKNKNKF